MATFLLIHGGIVGSYEAFRPFAAGAAQWATILGCAISAAVNHRPFVHFG